VPVGTSEKTLLFNKELWILGYRGKQACTEIFTNLIGKEN
jgi:hypothetical protein